MFKIRIELKSGSILSAYTNKWAITLERQTITIDDTEFDLDEVKVIAVDGVEEYREI